MGVSPGLACVFRDALDAAMRVGPKSQGDLAVLWSGFAWWECEAIRLRRPRTFREALQSFTGPRQPPFLLGEFTWADPEAA